jgi:hypothetical protein
MWMSKQELDCFTVSTIKDLALPVISRLHQNYQGGFLAYL